MTFELALVTGSDSGLGKELCQLVKRKNIEVLALTRAQADLATKEGREKVLDLIREKSPDLIINNAGLGRYGDASFMDLEEANEMIEVNIKALVEITIIGARTLIERKKQGVILNVSSLAGEIPTPGMAVYGGTKSFVTSFSKAVDMESRPYGVRILASLPGQIATSFATKAAKKPIPAACGAMDPSYAARQIWFQIEKKKQGYIYSSYHRLLHFMASCLPDHVALKYIYSSIRKDINHDI